MKRGTTEHPKTLDLAELLLAELDGHGITMPFELAKTLACGFLERLWHYTARYAPAGDVGKHSDAQIARALGWCHDARKFIEMLCRSGWMDEIGDCRLFVHDWHDHSDDAADKWLADKELPYANGKLSRRTPKAKRNDRKACRKKSRQVATSRDFPCPSESESESESESKSKSKSSWPSAIDRPDCRESWNVWIAYKRDRGERYKSAKSAKEQLDRVAAWGPERMIAAIRFSIAQNYQGIFEEDSKRGKRTIGAGQVHPDDAARLSGVGRM